MSRLTRYLQEKTYLKEEGTAVKILYLVSDLCTTGGRTIEEFDRDEAMDLMWPNPFKYRNIENLDKLVPLLKSYLLKVINYDLEYLKLPPEQKDEVRLLIARKIYEYTQSLSLKPMNAYLKTYGYAWLWPENLCNLKEKEVQKIGECIKEALIGKYGQILILTHTEVKQGEINNAEPIADSTIPSAPEQVLAMKISEPTSTVSKPLAEELPQNAIPESHALSTQSAIEGTVYALVDAEILPDSTKPHYQQVESQAPSAPILNPAFPGISDDKPPQVEFEELEGYADFFQFGGRGGVLLSTNMFSFLRNNPMQKKITPPLQEHKEQSLEGVKSDSSHEKDPGEVSEEGSVPHKEQSLRGVASDSSHEKEPGEVSKERSVPKNRHQVEKQNSEKEELALVFLMQI